MSKNTNWKGEGWYTVREWDPDRNDWRYPQSPYASWIDDPEWIEPCEGYEAVVEYYGDGILPSEWVSLDDDGFYTLRYWIDPYVGLHGADTYANEFQDDTVPDIDELVAPRDRLGYPARVKYEDWRKEYQRRYDEADADPSKQYPVRIAVEEAAFGQYDLYVNDEDVWKFDPGDDAEEIAYAVNSLGKCRFDRITGEKTEYLTMDQKQEAARAVNEAMGGNIDPAELSEAVTISAIAWRIAEAIEG